MISAAGSLNIVFNKDRFVSNPIAIKVSVLVNAIIKKSVHKSWVRSFRSLLSFLVWNAKYPQSVNHNVSRATALGSHNG